MISQNTVTVGNPSIKAVSFHNHSELILIAGPCVIESRAHALEMSQALFELTTRLRIALVYKSSFDKANRTSGAGERGLGMEKSLPILAEIRETFKIPVITDVHNENQCTLAAEVVDILQIPAFLCRQTDLLKAAAETGKALHIKKGQFLAPWDMRNVIEKIESFGNKDILICERGVSFGYNTLISDMRSLPILRSMGYPVIFDATHSVQQPGGLGTKSGGQREFVSILARAAVAVGIAGIFLETHQDPDQAPSDGPNMIPLKELEALLTLLMEFDRVSKSFDSPSPSHIFN